MVRYRRGSDIKRLLHNQLPLGTLSQHRSRHSTPVDTDTEVPHHLLSLLRARVDGEGTQGITLGGYAGNHHEPQSSVTRPDRPGG